MTNLKDLRRQTPQSKPFTLLDATEIFKLLLDSLIMEEVEQGVSTFPDPPKLFYKLYTDENVQSGLAPKPPSIIAGNYSTFGLPFDVSRIPLYDGCMM